MDITEKLPTVISFCSGYGGIERGLDLAGAKHRVLCYVEIEAFAIANLVAKMESGQLVPAPIFTDLKTFPAYLFRDCVDILTGGYPCQPFSAAGKRLGTEDPRHLWPFIRRHIESIRPVRCFFENVEGHISLGLSSVISDLEEDGYRATWGIFSAREVGAPHQRKRVYILADSAGKFSERRIAEGVASWKPEDAIGDRGAFASVADTISEGLQGSGITRNTNGKESQPNDQFASRCDTAQIRKWPPEPRLGRVVDGCPDRVDRIRLLGNGVVPQTAAKAWTTLTSRGKK